MIPMYYFFPDVNVFSCQEDSENFFAAFNVSK